MIDIKRIKENVIGCSCVTVIMDDYITVRVSWGSDNLQRQYDNGAHIDIDDFIQWANAHVPIEKPVLRVKAFNDDLGRFS